MKREFHMQMQPNPEFHLIHHHRCRNCSHQLPCTKPKCFRVARSKHMKKIRMHQCPECRATIGSLLRARSAKMWDDSVTFVDAVATNKIPKATSGQVLVVSGGGNMVWTDPPKAPPTMDDVKRLLDTKLKEAKDLGLWGVAGMDVVGPASRTEKVKDFMDRLYPYPVPLPKFTTDATSKEVGIALAKAMTKSLRTQKVPDTVLITDQVFSDASIKGKRVDIIVCDDISDEGEPSDE